MTHIHTNNTTHTHTHKYKQNTNALDGTHGVDKVLGLLRADVDVVGVRDDAAALANARTCRGAEAAHQAGVGAHAAAAAEGLAELDLRAKAAIAVLHALVTALDVADLAGPDVAAGEAGLGPLCAAGVGRAEAAVQGAAVTDGAAARDADLVHGWVVPRQVRHVIEHLPAAAVARDDAQALVAHAKVGKVPHQALLGDADELRGRHGVAQLRWRQHA